MQIGILETLGLGWKTKDEYIEKVKAVSVEQVQQVAKKYLIDKNLSVAVLDPIPINSEAMANKVMNTGGRHAN